MVWDESKLNEDNREKIKRLKVLYEINKSGFNFDLYREIITTEKTIPGFITDFHPSLEEKDSSNIEEKFLNYIISIVRKELLVNEGKDCRTDTLCSYCIVATNAVEKVCSCYDVEVLPFDFEGEFKQHRAVLLRFRSGNEYVIDLTYQQFFLIGNNLPQRRIVHNSSIIEGPYVGYQMLSGGFLDTAVGIIEKGFIPVDSDDFRPYVQGFIKAFYVNEEKDKYLGYSSGVIVDEIKRKRLIGHIGW